MALDNVSFEKNNGAGVPALDFKALIEAEVARQVAEARVEIDREISALKERALEDRAALVVFSGDLDKLLAGLVIATGAAAAGLETSLFFTFWGLSALKKEGAKKKRETLRQKLLAMMTPDGTQALGTSKMNFFGMGAKLFRQMMKDKDIQSVEELFALAQELGVKMTACTMSMDVMGVEREELIDGIELGGVAAFLADASGARLSLFI